MKKLIYSTLAIAAIFSTFSCRKEAMGDYQVADGVSVRGEFDADFQKTSIDEQGHVSWNAGDKVNFVWNKKFYFGTDSDIQKGWVTTTNKNDTTSASASFEVKLPYLDTYSGGYAEVFGVYPGVAGYTCAIDANNDLRIMIPTNYDFRAVTDGGFALSSITAGKVVFKSDKKASAVFMNICALLKVKLPANTAKFTVRVDPTSAPLAGYTTIDKDNFPSIIADGTTGKKYADTVLVSTTGLAAAATYYVPVLPGAMKLLAVTAFDKDGVVLGDTQSVSPNLERAQVYTIEMAESYSAHKRFMTTTGSGDKSGVNWENAWGLAEFSANINRPISDSVTVYIKQGTYAVTSALYNDNTKGGICVTNKTITLIGSLPSDNTGVEYGKNDPSKGPNIDGNSGGQATIFDGGGTANSGGGAKLFDFRGCNVTMKHIEFAHAGVKEGQRGTALYYSCNSGSENIKATLEKCYFVENYNSSTQYENGTGGAVYFNDATQTGTAEMEFKNCEFTGNSSGHSGGAVCMYVALGKIASATFTGCTFSGNGSRGNRGGAIHQEGGTVTIEESNFLSNKAMSYGGAISVSTSGGTSASSLSIADNNFGVDGDSSKKNWVYGTDSNQGGGGAIHARVEEGVNGRTATITSTKRNRFYGNTSTKSGGAMSLYNGASYTSHGDIFKGNYSEGANGGAIAAYYGCSLTFNIDSEADLPQGTLFYNNYAAKTNDVATSGQGGAVWMDASNMKTGAEIAYAESELSSTNSIFSENSCGICGGAVSFNGFTGYPGSVKFNGDSFSSNYATGNSSDGGAIYAFGTKLTLSGTFDSNYVTSNNNTSDGGAVFIYKCGTSSITSSSFYSNTANRDGGAVYVNMCNGLTVSSCTFGAADRGNQATNGYGGAVRIIAMTSSTVADENSAKFSSNTFAYNTAGNCGGAIAAINSSVPDGQNIGLEFIASSPANTFSYNSAVNYGGAIELSKTVGGAIETNNTGGFCRIAGCSFNGNVVTASDRNNGGSAIHCQGLSSNPLRVNVSTGCKFNSNKSTSSSAAVLLGEHSHLRMSRAYFYANEAAYTADVRIVDPAAASQDAYAYITNSVFENSKSTAGAACGISISVGKVDGDLVSGTLAINNCSFYGQSHSGTPSVSGDRSVIFCRYNPALIINSTIFGSSLGTSGTLASMTYLSGTSTDKKVVLCNNIISGGISDSSNRVYSIQGTNSTVSTSYGFNWMFQPNGDFGNDMELAGKMNRINAIMATNTFISTETGGRSAKWRGGLDKAVTDGYLEFTNNVEIANYATQTQISSAINDYVTNSYFNLSESASTFFESVKFGSSNNYTSLQVDITGSPRFTTSGNPYTLPGSWHSDVPNQKTIVPTINPITNGDPFDWGGAQ